MAIQLSFSADTGVTGNYWRILSYSCGDKNQKRSTVCLGLFLDKSASDAGKTPILTQSHYWNLTDYPFSLDALNPLNSNPLSVAYLKLKTVQTPIDFTQAIDV